MCLTYNLDSDTLEIEGENQVTVTEKEDLKLVVNYDFKVSDLETYRYHDGIEEKT